VPGRPSGSLVAEDRSAEGRPRPDRTGPSCLCARLGPRLVHTPSVPSGLQRSPGVSSGRSFAQVAGAILRKQAPGLNPDKDEVPGSSPGRPTTHSRRSERCRSEPGALAAGLGRAGAARPSPPAPPLAPPGPPTRTSGSATTTHRGRAPSRGRQPRGGCSHLVLQPCSRAHRAAARDGRSERRPGLPGRSAGKRGRRGPHPTRRPGSASHLPVTNANCGSVARVPGSWTVDRAVDGPAATGASTGFRWSRLPGNLDPVLNATA
jgi:hypothetical protein